MNSEKVESGLAIDPEEEEMEKRRKEFEQARNKIKEFHSSNAKVELQKLYDSLRNTHVFF